MNIEEVMKRHGFRFSASCGGQASYTRFVKYKGKRALRAHFPTMTLEIIKDAAHWVHMDAPERFLRRIREWLSVHASNV